MERSPRNLNTCNQPIQLRITRSDVLAVLLIFLIFTKFRPNQENRFELNISPLDIDPVQNREPLLDYLQANQTPNQPNSLSLSDLGQNSNPQRQDINNSVNYNIFFRPFSQQQINQLPNEHLTTHDRLFQLRTEFQQCLDLREHHKRQEQNSGTQDDTPNHFIENHNQPENRQQQNYNLDPQRSFPFTKSLTPHPEDRPQNSSVRNVEYNPSQNDNLTEFSDFADYSLNQNQEEISSHRLLPNPPQQLFAPQNAQSQAPNFLLGSRDFDQFNQQEISEPINIRTLFPLGDFQNPEVRQNQNTQDETQSLENDQKKRRKRLNSNRKTHSDSPKRIKDN